MAATRHGPGSSRGMIAGRMITAGREPGQVFDLAAGQEKALNAVEVADAELGVGPCLDLRAFEGRAAFSEYAVRMPL